jgi:biotin carboxyl carrier protein
MKAPRDAVVVKVAYHEGDIVAEGKKLIIFEE